MAKNRTSTHRGKVGNAKHNEHRFYDEENIDTTLHSFIHQKENESWDLTFDELKFYERYAPSLAEQNEKYLQQRQYKRVKTLENFYNSKRYKPTEEIIQYGHAGGEVPDRDTYEKMTKEYARRKNEWSKQHGNHLHVLDYANHYDEATPHTHLREIWDYADDEGILRVSQEEAMKRAGLTLPDPSKPEGRYNNRSMTYTKMCREMWQDICEEFGFEVERTPLPGKQKSKSIGEYKAQKQREILEREEEFARREADLIQKEQDLKQKEDSIDSRMRDVREKEDALEEAQRLAKEDLDKREAEIHLKEKNAVESLQKALEVLQKPEEPIDSLVRNLYVYPEVQDERGRKLRSDERITIGELEARKIRARECSKKWLQDTLESYKHDGLEYQ